MRLPGLFIVISFEDLLICIRSSHSVGEDKGVVLRILIVTDYNKVISVSDHTFFEKKNKTNNAKQKT